MKAIWQIAWLAGLIVLSGNVLGSASWWMLCDQCVTDSGFEFEAMRAPGTYTTVYVSNRQTNETRKYDREIISDDFDDGLQQLTTVTLAFFPIPEQAAFEQAIENANEGYRNFPRSSLNGLINGLYEQPSIVGDISNGVIDTALTNGIRRLIEQAGLLPTWTSVNGQAGLSIVGTGGQLGAGQTIRVKDLVIEIIYEDGSSLAVTRRASDGEYVDWTLTDADDNRIPVENAAQGGTSINPTLFGESEFVFGVSSQTDALIFMDFIQRTSSLECSASTTTGPDGTDRMVVRCSRTLG